MESSVAQAETQEMTARPAHPLKYMAAWFLFRIRVSGSYFDMLAKKVAEGKSNFVNVGSNCLSGIKPCCPGTAEPLTTPLVTVG